MTEKPLHVQVAEALGWQRVDLGTWHVKGSWAGKHPSSGNLARVPRYDLDWSATGPLIERYGISLVVPDEFNPEHREHRYVAGTGGAHGWDDGSVCMDNETGGPTPLIAVCNLILALKAEGKLT